MQTLVLHIFRKLVKIVMIIHHIALWTPDLERMRTYYEKYFGAVAGEKYTNPIKQVETYFLSFAGETRLEIMHRQSLAIPRAPTNYSESGYAHISLSVGSRGKVDQTAARFKADGCVILDGPRLTGDGYYEFTTLDPDGNRVEVTE
jgi:lactoylglutathione lyase